MWDTWKTSISGLRECGDKIGLSFFGSRPGKMYQRPAHLIAPAATLPNYPRLESKQKIATYTQCQRYNGPCGVDCIQGIKLVWFGHDHAMISYCVVHKVMGEACLILKGIFLAAHQSGELYPGGTRQCYDGQYFKERLYRISELLPCPYCGLRFLSENDRNDPKVGFHRTREL